MVMCLITMTSMKTKRKERPLETAICGGCGKPFQRFANVSRKRTFCDAENCQKIKKISNSIAKFEDLPQPTASIYREIHTYNGGYSE